jgi:hypothetical protein
VSRGFPGPGGVAHMILVKPDTMREEQLAGAGDCGRGRSAQVQASSHGEGATKLSGRTGALLLSTNGSYRACFTHMRSSWGGYAVHPAKIAAHSVANLGQTIHLSARRLRTFE